MWCFRSKCQRIGPLIKASRKQLKASLTSEVKKFGPSFLVLILGEFPSFDSFLDLNNFQLSDLPVFGFICFNPLLPSMSSTSLAINILAPSTSLAASTGEDIVVFSINVNDTTILLNLWMNYQ